MPRGPLVPKALGVQTKNPRREFSIDCPVGGPDDDVTVSEESARPDLSTTTVPRAWEAGGCGVPGEEHGTSTGERASGARAETRGGSGRELVNTPPMAGYGLAREGLG